MKKKTKTSSMLEYSIVGNSASAENEGGGDEEPPDSHPSASASPSSDAMQAKPDRVLNVWKLMFIAFFLTCGGPYGIEDLVSRLLLFFSSLIHALS